MTTPATLTARVSVFAAAGVRDWVARTFELPSITECRLISLSLNDVYRITSGTRRLYRRMYRHLRVMEIMGDAEKIVADLFGHYLAHPEELPPGWLPQGAAGDEIARRIGDFIAGMTDRFALSEHLRIFDSTPDLR